MVEKDLHEGESLTALMGPYNTISGKLIKGNNVIYGTFTATRKPESATVKDWFNPNTFEVERCLCVEYFVTRNTEAYGSEGQTFWWPVSEDGKTYNNYDKAMRSLFE